MKTGKLTTLPGRYYFTREGRSYRLYPVGDGYIFDVVLVGVLVKRRLDISMFELRDEWARELAPNDRNAAIAIRQDLFWARIKIQQKRIEREIGSPDRCSERTETD